MVCSQSCELMVILSNSNLPMPSKIPPAVRDDNWTDQIYANDYHFETEYYCIYSVNSTKEIATNNQNGDLVRHSVLSGHYVLLCPTNSVNHHLSLKIFIPIEIYLQKSSFITFQSK